MTMTVQQQQRARVSRERELHAQTVRTSKAAKAIAARLHDLAFDDWQRKEIEEWFYRLLNDFTPADRLKAIQDTLLGEERR